MKDLIINNLKEQSVQYTSTENFRHSEIHNGDLTLGFNQILIIQEKCQNILKKKNQEAKKICGESHNSGTNNRKKLAVYAEFFVEYIIILKNNIYFFTFGWIDVSQCIKNRIVIYRKKFELTFRYLMELIDCRNKY
ncbi:hypothetical protein BpHYR1_025861 [Brachionus plicatilis]|uniref:Uncharacterized protein n=1 Tax=Brachionus plicatilis TaxID=10195 RepID=A0A3M7RDD3_BRAPC|nr:hypothetical protein BpHYR1_025861 [Brachionus plicatilis]